MLQGSPIQEAIFNDQHFSKDCLSIKEKNKCLLCPEIAELTDSL